MDNICAISTPHGLGGIAVIRVSGPDAIAIVDAHFRPFKAGHTLSTRATHTLTFGQFFRSSRPQGAKSPYGGDLEGLQGLIDEVVCSLYRAPHSFTGEDVVEISCHGSLYIQQEILNALCDNSSFLTPNSSLGNKSSLGNNSSFLTPNSSFSPYCRLAKPGEYTRRAFENGRMDLSQAEAVADLIASQTAAAHRVAMSQMKGSISHKLDDMRAQLLELSSLLELELDFSEEDVEFADRQKLVTLTQQIIAECERLSSTFAAGNAIKNGIPVAIIGAPNVGKSTLLNALLKEDRAIVSDIQGTTRDVIEDTITLTSPTGGGWEGAFRFIDTAGIRHTTDTIEQLGIERSRQAAAKAQIIILLTEPGVPYPDIEARPDQTLLHVLNKVDKGNNSSSASGNNSSFLTPHSSLDNRSSSGNNSSFLIPHSSLDNRSSSGNNSSSASGNNSSFLIPHSSFIPISAKIGLGLDALEQRLIDIANAATAGSNDVIITNVRHKQALDNAATALHRALDGLHANLSGDLVVEDLKIANQSLGEILSGGTIGSQEVLNNIFSHFCIGK